MTAILPYLLWAMGESCVAGIVVAAGSPGTALLNEDGTPLLNEDGTPLLNE